jgi:hypothetical protein
MAEIVPDPLPRHEGFLNAHVEILAANAWRGYRADGRGALMVCEREFLSHPEVTRTGFHSLYIGERGIVLAELFSGRWCSERVARWVREYDPYREFIALVAQEDTHLNEYRIHSPLAKAPPIAAKILRDLFS